MERHTVATPGNDGRKPAYGKARLDTARSVARALPGDDIPRWTSFSARRPPRCVIYLGHPRRLVDAGPLESPPLLQERYGVNFAVVLSGEALVETEAALAGDLTIIAFSRNDDAEENKKKTNHIRSRSKKRSEQFGKRKKKSGPTERNRTEPIGSEQNRTVYCFDLRGLT